MSNSVDSRVVASLNSTWVAARNNPWLVIAAIICIFGLTYNFSGYPLLDPDEGRNAEVAREMADGGGVVVPQLNGLPYLDKPILYFALGAASMKLLGPTVLAARLPSLLLTLATVALVGWFGARIFGRSGAWTAILATASMPFTLAYSRTVIFDSTLTFFVVLALVAFYMATAARDHSGLLHGMGERGPPAGPSGSPATRGRMGEWWTTIAWTAMALGVLTKGPIALAIPLMVAIPFAAWRRAWRTIADPLSLLLFAALLTPWLFGVSRQIPDFLHYAIVTETANRLTTDELQRTGPIWYFLAILPAAALPWSLVAIGAWRTIKRRRDRHGNMDGRVVYLLLWILIPLLFFSLSQSKRPQYILPLVPAVALLVAAAWHGSRDRLPGARVAATGIALLGAFFLTVNRIIPDLVPASSTVSHTIPATALVLGFACMLAGVLAWLTAHRLELVLIAFAIPVAAVPVASQRLMDAIGDERSAATIARMVESAAGADARVIGVAALPLSLPFYLEHPVLLATEDGSELTSNYIIRHFDDYAGSSTLRPADWWRTALVECNRPTVFVVSAAGRHAREILRAALDLMLETRKYAVYGPCGITNLAHTPVR